MQELLKNYSQQQQDFDSLNQLDDSLSTLRQASLTRLGKNGFPTAKDENWRYTNVKPLLKQAFNVITSSQFKLTTDQLTQFDIAGFASIRMVIVDGVLDTDLSAKTLPDELEIKSLSDVLKSEPDYASKYLNHLLPDQTHGFMDLNTAFIGNGVWIETDKDFELETAIELIYVSTGADHSLVQPRNVIIAGDGSDFKVIERYVSLTENKTMTNTITEIYCEPNSILEHVRIQQESRASNHLSGTFVKLDAKAHFSTSTITLGGNLTRNDLRCQISGSGSHANLYGLYATNQRQHVDNFTQVEHQVPNCTSDELYKGVLDDRSRAVFHGRIYVAEDAQHTDAYQNNRTLLLSRDAEIDTKPQLEIYADDVKCSHGATIGQLNKEYLFYLCARGVEKSKARRMLTFAFIKEALGAISIEPLKVYLEDQLDKQLLKGGHYGD